MLFNKSLICVSAFVLCSGVVFGFVAHSHQLLSHMRMAQHPTKTVGTVTGKQPENRNHVTYRFKVNEQLYEGESGVGDAYETTAIGATVPVTYDARNPQMSRVYDPDNPHQWNLVSPKDAIKELLVIISIFSLVGGAMFAVPIWVIALVRKPGGGATEHALGADSP